MRRNKASLRHALAASVLLLSAAAGGCSQAASETAATLEAPSNVRTHPESGLNVIPLVVKTGTVAHTFQVEVARSRFEQAQGMMFRRAMGQDEGMLFPFEVARRASFWMRNTVIPLDIIFIGPDGRILNVAADARPYSEDNILSEGPAAAVLELVGGRAAQLGIKAGDKVEWEGSKPLASPAAGR
jgi:uncharacterized protein